MKEKEKLKFSTSNLPLVSVTIWAHLLPAFVHGCKSEITLLNYYQLKLRTFRYTYLRPREIIATLRLSINIDTHTPAAQLARKFARAKTFSNLKREVCETIGLFCRTNGSD